MPRDVPPDSPLAGAALGAPPPLCPQAALALDVWRLLAGFRPEAFAAVLPYLPASADPDELLGLLARMRELAADLTHG